jgi:hypothetical protein
MANDAQATLRTPHNFEDVISIVPFSGIQTLDFGFSIEGQRIRTPFAEIVTIADADLDGDNAKLIPLSGDVDADKVMMDVQSASSEVHYEINERQAMSPFLEKWIPIPVLRLRKERGPKGTERYDNGPSTWARLRVTELEQIDPKTGHSHRVQLALDTALVDSNPDYAYLAPELDDSRNPRDFRFVADPKNMTWFLRRPAPELGPDGSHTDFQAWVSDWVKHLFDQFLGQDRRNHPVEDGLAFEHWARYLAFLQVIDKMIHVPLFRLINTVSERDRDAPVDVDLVLDIGNSRTCGILVEQFPGDGRVDLSKSYELAVRDLSRPEFYYAGLIASRVEFAEMTFGADQFAAGSGRRNSFLWPSFVRVGPEALRLVQAEQGTETLSGLSSPKRYLWDNNPTTQDWRFHAHNDTSSLPRGARAAMQFLNEMGDVLPQVEEEEKRKLRERNPSNHKRAIRPRFSRSSLYGFMLAEIISHALVQINDPAERARHLQSDVPRRLKRIILTLPTATPMQEQSIIRSRAEGALKLVWKRMQNTGQTAKGQEMPKLIVEWDEASCTQMVFLYNEIMQKFGGRIDQYLSLLGKPRRVTPEVSPTPSLRICSIDVGGGTTDLMITTFHSQDDKVLLPQQNFREGFRIAGDDILAKVISTVLLPQIGADVRQAGGTNINAHMAELFGGDVGGMDQRTVQLRRQYVLRVLVPLAVSLLEQSETADADSLLTLSPTQILGALPRTAHSLEASEDPTPDLLDLPETLLNFLDLTMQTAGAKDWALNTMNLSIPRRAIDAAVREVMQSVLYNMAEVIDHLDCDFVLLTGRPSRLPGLRDVLENTCVVKPDRLLSMHDYRTDQWYPYRDRVTQKIGDPKTTVAVGAMLMALADNRIANFAVRTDAFQMRSTIRYIGEMEVTGQILENRVLFKDEDEVGKISKINMVGPVHLGSRQLPLERWTTTPLYRLDFVSPEKMRGRTPVKVPITRRDFDDDAEGTDEVLRSEALKEAFSLMDGEDCDGGGVKHKAELALRLHTLGMRDDYWLDTGTFILT